MGISMGICVIYKKNKYIQLKDLNKKMGKQTNSQILRFLKNKDWLSKYYSSYFNYSNLIVQDILIRDYVINFISLFNTKVAQVFIYREKHNIIIRIFSYNDS